MIITATDEQVRQMMALACNASVPAGVGFIHYNFKHKASGPVMIEFMTKREAYIDYWNGRMVKFYGQKVAENQWQFSDKVNIEYQSWANKYPSYQALFDALDQNEVIQHVSSNINKI